jgi:ureidoacrylate peracid hydrolase
MTMKIGSHVINPALIVVDMQNGFVSEGGSYDVLGMDTSQYQKVIPKIQELMKLCRDAKIPIFHTQGKNLALTY